MTKWQERILEDVVEKFIDYRGKTPVKTSYGVPLVTAKIVKNGKILKPTEFISEAEYPIWMRRGYPKTDDVVLTTEAPLGEVGILKIEKIALAQRIILIRGKKNLLHNHFLKFYLQSPLGQETLRARASGSTVSGIKAAELKRIPILVPCYAEQRAIAAVLSNLDDKIDLLQRQNATLEAMAEALFKKWFVVEAKEEWEEFALKDIAYQIKNSISPQNYPQENFYLYSIPAYDLNKIPEVVCGKSILSNKFLVGGNCILISKLNPQFPRIWFIMDDIQKNSISSTEFISVNPYNKQELPFIYCLFKNNNVSSELARSASGTSGSHQRIKPEDIFSVTFSAPNRQYLTEFSNQVLPMFEHIHMNQTQIRTLEKLRDTLLPKLMSGEVRVSLD